MLFVDLFYYLVNSTFTLECSYLGLWTMWKCLLIDYTDESICLLNLDMSFDVITSIFQAFSSQLSVAYDSRTAFHNLPDFILTDHVSRVFCCRLGLPDLQPCLPSGLLASVSISISLRSRTSAALPAAGATDAAPSSHRRVSTAP